MKLKITSLSLIFIVFFTSIFAQENVLEKLIKPLQENTLYREKVFLHTNKSIYFSNETIWITAYVAEDAENKPSVYSSNLYLNLINSEGNVIEQKNIFVQNGVGFGDFSLNQNLTSGSYFIQGFTNYMQNFGAENMFIQEIEFINSTQTIEKKIENFTNSYDIQLFPESGYLLKGTENSIGIKALINGKGYPFSGSILNSKGTVVNTFSGNNFGLGKCTFNYIENETYSAVIHINKTTQIIDLPKAKTTGIIFSLDNSNEKLLILTIKTNLQTLPNLEDYNLTLLFYRNNYISEAATLSLISNDETTQDLIFDKSKLLHGVNTVTLFKNNEPIAERKFYVDKSSQQTAVLIDKIKTENDSISYKIKTLNANLSPISAQLSLSVLPKESLNYNENQTIKSAFLLTPYIKGNIENPYFYFKNSNPKEKEFLDLLLINQGWITYTLEDKIKEINPSEKYKFESGFDIRGKILKAPDNYELGLLSKNEGLAALSKIDNNEFVFKNVFTFKNDVIKIALVKNDFPLIKPKNISLKIDSIQNKNYHFITNNYYKQPIIKATEKVESTEFRVTNFNNYPNVEVLKQIMLKTVHSKKGNTIYDEETNLAIKHKILAPSFYEGKKVTEQMEITYLNVLHYFQTLGIVKGLCPFSCFIELRNTKLSFLGKKEPKIYIDDVPYQSEESIDLFESISMLDVDEILINKTGFGGGIDASGGIIRIYRKKGDHKYFDNGKIKLYEELLNKTGFDRANNYYKPQYNIYTEEAFNWSEIDWKNNIKTNEDGEYIIKIPTNEFLNEFKFIINGFSENGLLFYNNTKTTQRGF